MNLPPFWLYVLQSQRDKKFYVGTTSNVVRRLRQHELGETPSTRNRRPLILVYCEGHQSIVDARRRERYFKTSKGRTVLKTMIRDSMY